MGSQSEGNVGKLRSGTANLAKIQNGLIIKFDSPIHDWTADDMLLIKTPDGEVFEPVLIPASVREKHLVVSIRVNLTVPGISDLEAELVPISDNEARLDISEHRAKLIASLKD